jgi:hypothetical protein
MPCDPPKPEEAQPRKGEKEKVRYGQQRVAELAEVD